MIENDGSDWRLNKKKVSTSYTNDANHAQKRLGRLIIAKTWVAYEIWPYFLVGVHKARYCIKDPNTPGSEEDSLLFTRIVAREAAFWNDDFASPNSHRGLQEGWWQLYLQRFALKKRTLDLGNPYLL